MRRRRPCMGFCGGWGMSEFVTLGDHIRIQKGKPPSKVGDVGADAEPYLSPEFLRGRDAALMAKAGPDAVRCADGDTVLLWDGSNAGEFFKGRSGLVASTMAKITPSEAFHGDFFHHVAKHAEIWLKSQTSGTGIPHVDRELLESIRAFCPDEKQQQRIAGILDTVDTAVRDTEAVIAKLKAVKQGLLHDLLTRGIDANGELRPPQGEAPQRYKMSPLGWIPQQWEAQPLSELCGHEIRYGIVQAGPHVQDGVPYIRTGDMAGESLVRDEMLRTTHRIAKSYARSEIKAGEIVMAIRATVGKVLPVPDELDGANLTQGTARISPNSQTDSNFLLYAIRHQRAQKSIQLQIKGTTFAEITLAALRQVPIAKPVDLVEQQEIGRRMMLLDDSIHSESDALQKMMAKKSALMDDLLTGRVRVTPLLETADA